MLVYDPTDVRYAHDPWSLYAELRTNAPIHKNDRGMWVLSRHADCLTVLRDRRSSSDATNIDPTRVPDGFGRARVRAVSESVDSPGPPVSEEEAFEIEMEDAFHEGRPFLFRDPPDHARLRGLVSSAFTPRMVEGLRPRVEAIVNELLDNAFDRGEMDVVADFAYPLPVRIICEMLGVPTADQERFSDWSAALARGLDPDFLLTDEVRQARLLAVAGFAEYFFELLADRRKNPGDDLLSHLVAAEDGGDTLSEGELLSTSILLLVAGHETTVNLIGGSVQALVDFPDEAIRLREDPSLQRGAVKEFLRFVSPVQLTGRTMLDDLPLGEVTLPKGEFVVTLIGAANRDPEVFDDPDRLDLARADSRHLGFGFGLHHCLGAPLARLETQVALAGLLRRSANFDAVLDAPRYRDNVVLRGLAELPIRLTETASSH